MLPVAFVPLVTSVLNLQVPGQICDDEERYHCLLTTLLALVAVPTDTAVVCISTTAPPPPKSCRCLTHPLCPHSGPNRGHYITIVKSHGFWLLFDDDIVEVRNAS